MYIIYDEVKNSFMSASGSFSPDINDALRFLVEKSAEAKSISFANVVVIPITVSEDFTVEIA